MSERVDIVINAKDQATKEFNRTNKAVIGLKKSTAALGIGFVAMGAAVLLGTKRIIAIASEAEETRAKFNAVFKDMAVETRAWAEDFGESVGRSRIDVEQWMARLQDTFVPLGFSRDKAAELSKELTKLAVDVASFNNASDPETINLFTSALVGNHEAVRRFGITISEVSLKQEAINLGWKKAYSDLSDLEKVQLRYNLIMKGSADAQGDAVRTSESYANQMKRLRAEMKDLGDSLGQFIIPAITSVVKGFGKAVDTIDDFIRALKPKMLDDYITKLQELGVEAESVTAIVAQGKLIDLQEKQLELTEKIVFAKYNEKEALEIIKNTQLSESDILKNILELNNEKIRTQKEANRILDFATDEYKQQVIYLRDDQLAAINLQIRLEKERLAETVNITEEEKKAAREVIGALEARELIMLRIAHLQKVMRGEAEGPPSPETGPEAIAARFKEGLTIQKEHYEQETAALELRNEIAGNLQDANIQMWQEYYDKQRSASEDNLKAIKAAQDRERQLLEAHTEHMARVYTQMGMETTSAMGKALIEGKPVLKEGFKALLAETIRYLEMEIIAVKVAAIIKTALTGGALAVKELAGYAFAMVALEGMKAAFANYQRGIGYVPYTQTTIVHQGERVMSATENRAVVDALGRIEARMGQQGGGDTYNISAIDTISFRDYMRRGGYSVISEDIRRGKFAI